MSQNSLLIEILLQVSNSIAIVQKRFKTIESPNDFLDTEEGLQLLDSICMQLIAIGESIKNLDKRTKGGVLINYPEIDWKGIMGIRDIISHHYFDIDAEEIFYVCKHELVPLSETLATMMLAMKDK
jgi:uncharacterized protein with HEPN domain